MKNKIITLLFAILFSICGFYCGYAQDKSKEAEKPASGEEYETINPNILMINLGYGSFELAAGLGFRYSFNNTPFALGAMVGFTGFTITSPPVRYPTNIGSDVFPKEAKNFPENITKLVLCIDAVAYYDYSERLSLFGNIGYYTRNDSIYYKDPATGYYYVSQTIYQNQQYGTLPQSKTESGACFGLGLQYFISEKITLGLAYHSQLGVYAQLGYAWY